MLRRCQGFSLGLYLFRTGTFSSRPTLWQTLHHAPRMRRDSPLSARRSAKGVAAPARAPPEYALSFRPCFFGWHPVTSRKVSSARRETWQPGADGASRQRSLKKSLPGLSSRGRNFHRADRLTARRNTSPIRVCQPGPSLRKYSITCLEGTLRFVSSLARRAGSWRPDSGQFGSGWFGHVWSSSGEADARDLGVDAKRGYMGVSMPQPCFRPTPCPRRRLSYSAKLGMSGEWS